MDTLLKGLVAPHDVQKPLVDERESILAALDQLCVKSQYNVSLSTEIRELLKRGPASASTSRSTLTTSPTTATAPAPDPGSFGGFAHMPMPARSPFREFPPSSSSSSSVTPKPHPNAPTITRTDRGLHISMPTPGDVTATPASEYFANQGLRTGSASGSAVVMQSPDGRPFGVFFEPPVKSDRRVSAGASGRPLSSGGTRKSFGRKTSIVVERERERERETPEDGSPANMSPSGSRRASGFSAGETAPPSRRNSTKEGEGSGMNSPVGSGRKGRRGSNAVVVDEEVAPPAQAEPVIAKGRAKGESLVKTASRRRASGPSGQSSPATEVPPKVAPTAGKDAEVKPKSKKKAKDEDMVVPPINVLIVEDNPINQNILSMFLKKKKIKHQTAKDGEEAVKKWKTGGFHLILMDIQLPVKDGIEATREIRDLERNSNIGVFPMTPATEMPSRQLSLGSLGAIPPSPLRSSVIIVALTASSLQTDRVNALAAGCNDFLTKPVSLKWLEQKTIEWGCMQALIDFDGWRRWKSADPKDPANETKKGFQTMPNAAAKSIAGRLKINPERRSLRQSSTSSQGSIIVPDPSATPSTANTNTSSAPSSATAPPHPHPEIAVHTATPTPLDPSGPGSDGSQRSAEQKEAAEELEKARMELQDLTPVVAPIAVDEERLLGKVGASEPEELEAVAVRPSLADLRAGSMGSPSGSGGSAGVSAEPDLGSIMEADGQGGGDRLLGERVEKKLPAVPPQ